MQESKWTEPAAAQATNENANYSQETNQVEGHLSVDCRILQGAYRAGKGRGWAGVAIETGAGNPLKQWKVDIEEVGIEYESCAQLHFPARGLLKEIY